MIVALRVFLAFTHVTSVLTTDYIRHVGVHPGVNKCINKRDLTEILVQVICVVASCGSRTEREKEIGFYQIPAIITKKGEFEEELMRARRNRWISQINRGDTKRK